MNNIQKSGLGLGAMLMATLVYSGAGTIPVAADGAKVRGLDNPMQSHSVVAATNLRGETRIFDRKAIVESGTMKASRSDSYQASHYLSNLQ